MTKIGGSSPSSMPPRRQAATSPTSVPITNARIVVVPTSTSVQGRACKTSWATASGKNVKEMPKCPCAMLPRYVKYARINDWWVLIPKAISIACNACGWMRPL